MKANRLTNRLLLTAAALAVCTASMHASTVYLANSVTETTAGGSAQQPFSNTNTGAGFSGGNTITSGTTTLETALTYTALPQLGATGNGRFASANGLATSGVNYNYSTARTLDGVLFWNYNEYFSPLTYNDRGATSANITVTYDEGQTLILADVALTLTPDTDDINQTAAAQQISFGQQLANVTQIRFTDLQGTSTTHRGWQEMAAYQIPEPSAALLGGLGILAFVLRRRK